jgi:RNA polymerase sigma-70 factor (ECF subfamily)
MARVIAGDAGALERLYDLYAPTCLGLASRILADSALAQDVVQEVFVAVWRHAVRFDPDRGTVATYLLSVAHHKAVDSVRREENLRRRRAPADVLESMESDLSRVDDEVWSGLRRERVRAALKELPAVQCEALALAYFGGYTQREIAGITGTPLGTVKTRMMAGMRRLATVLSDPLGDGPRHVEAGG